MTLATYCTRLYLTFNHSYLKYLLSARYPQELGLDAQIPK